jgi:hypothetical protein
MSSRKTRINHAADDVEHRFMNWITQLLNMCMPWACWWFAGRASAKTTQLLAERLKQAVEECPGAPFAWIADTYSNLHQNVIPSLLEGLRFLGMEEGRDFVIDTRPPESWRRQMYNVVSSFKHTMTFYNGTTVTFFSLDRPSIGAGRSFVAIFGDEIKYWKEEQFTNILKTVRGYYAKYGNNPWYRSRTFTTDLPNPNHIGEYDWCFKIVKSMDIERVKLLIKVSLIYNDTRAQYAIALQELHEAEANGVDSQTMATLRKQLADAEKLMNRWHDRWVKARCRVTMAMVSSTFVNIDVLGTEFFEDEMKESLEGFETNILSIRPKLAANQKFYPTLTADNFYSDGYDNNVIDKFEYGWQEDCTVLKYLDRNRYIEAGMDAGNMLSMAFGQRNGKTYRLLKELYTISPQTERDLADKFLAYFKPMRIKVLHLYYDRAMNNYQKQRADMASKIKAAIERDANGRATGWRVILKSRGQGDIYSDVEYRFMMALLAGQLKDRLFTLLIDRHNCECTKAEMENCPTKVTKDRFNRDVIRKEKKGDKLSFDRLPKESSNLTDAVKYLLMRKEWVSIWSSPGGGISLDPK